MYWKKLHLVLIFCLFQIAAFAQSTRVKGVVTDAETGEALPFVGIYFKGTTIGVSTDFDGNYSIETREHAGNVICVNLLGYETLEANVKPGAFNELNFKLTPLRTQLNASRVKADDHKVRRLLKLINEHKPQNDPENMDYYDCDTYSRLELDIVDPARLLRNKHFQKNFGFVMDYVDTSIVSGRTYLPAMISENLARNYHSKNPSFDKEEIIANKISGIENTPTLAQFTGSMHMKTSLYQNYLTVFDVKIPSPLLSSGMMYYNYFLIDSLQVDGRKTYKLRFHPVKTVSSPVFDGEISIDAEEYALKEAHIKLQRAANVNWIKDYVIDIENVRTDSGWFYKRDKLYMEFSPEKKDSSKVVTFFGTRTIDYSNPVFTGRVEDDMRSAHTNVLLSKNVVKNDEEFWQQARPFELSEKEANIYKMVDAVKQAPLYQDVYSILEAIINGYYTLPKAKWLQYGPWFKTVSYDNLEGVRVQIGGRTTSDFSRHVRLTGYGAYGFKDRGLKGEAKAEFIFGDNQPTRKLTVDFKRDVVQLGKSAYSFTENNIMNSVLTKGNTAKMSPVNEYSVDYEHEFLPGVNAELKLQTIRIYANQYVPMITPNHYYIGSVGSNDLSASLRFSWNEMITRGVFDKYYIYSDFPVIKLIATGALKGLGRNDYTYFRPEVEVTYNLSMPPCGTSTIFVNAGVVKGKVPYPMLKLLEGNGSYFLDAGAFSCMNYYEFAADSWVKVFYRHNFRGFFFGKVPLLKKLGVRENVYFRAAYGTIRPENDGSHGPESQSILMFPEGMQSLKKPYVEVGAGLSNILKFIRIDYYHRLTHTGSGHDGALNFGVELAF